MNRLLATRCLAKAGCEVDVAPDGREVVSKFHPDRHDLVLMDIQMPDMDGFAALRGIREREAGAGRAATPVPVAAFTAVAFSGQRDNYLKAGMSGFLPKPFTFDELVELLSGQLPHLFLSRRTASADEAGEPPDDGILDLAAARKHVEHDNEFLLELVTIFRTQYPVRLAEMRKGMDSRCAAIAGRAAHTLSGMAGVIGGTRLRAMARKAENEFAAGRFGRTEELVGNLRREAESLATAIEAALNSGETA